MKKFHRMLSLVLCAALLISMAVLSIYDEVNEAAFIGEYTSGS